MHFKLKYKQLFAGGKSAVREHLTPPQKTQTNTQP